MSADIERAAFEAWVSASDRSRFLERDERHGWYKNLTTTAWWTAWQARATPQAPTCHHRIADARNPYITSGYLCVDCGAVFSAADHDTPQAPTPAAAEVHQWRRRDVDMWHDTTKEDAYSCVDEIYEARTLYASLVAAPLPRQAAEGLSDTDRMDLVAKSGVRGSTYKGITSINVIVHEDDLLCGGARYAIDCMIERDSSAPQPQEPK